METGRTEHFTDEGMLGAVHAFLDEVFDGRDMLLRSALNVLHERELKQGTKITRGKIECALMTTNRYLAEILGRTNAARVRRSHRVPRLRAARVSRRPSALEQVLRTAGRGPQAAALETRLTIQDLDVLQAAVDGVTSTTRSAAPLAELIQRFDAELAARPARQPHVRASRYLSTRDSRAPRAACCARCASTTTCSTTAKRPLEARAGSGGAAPRR